MNADAARFMQYKKTGKFIPVTPYAGIESAKAVLSEDARFPASKKGLIEQQGWKVVDLTPDKRVHLSEVLVNLPEKTYRDLNEVVKALGGKKLSKNNILSRHFRMELQGVGRPVLSEGREKKTPSILSSVQHRRDRLNVLPQPFKGYGYGLGKVFTLRFCVHRKNAQTDNP